MSEATCELCGEPMPANEQMFKYHGYSGPCPKPMKVRENPTDALRKALQAVLKSNAELLSILTKAYRSGHREGWEEGPSNNEVMSEIHDILHNAGIDPNKDRTP